MVKRKNKRFLWIGGVVLAVVLIAWFTPIRGLLFFGQPVSCEVNGYDSDCYCSEGEDKIFVPWVGVDRWDCENPNWLILNPASDNFEEESVVWIQDYLSAYCGYDCDTEYLNSCGSVCESPNDLTVDNPRCMLASWGYGNNGERLVNVECQITTEFDSEGRPVSGYTPWRMMFYIESETGTPLVEPIYEDMNYCINLNTGIRCDPPIQVVG